MAPLEKATLFVVALVPSLVLTNINTTLYLLPRLTVGDSVTHGRVLLYISHIIQLTQELSAEPKHSASAEALTVARRPKEASREKTRPPPVSGGSFP